MGLLYMLSSLPPLQFNGSPPISIRKFYNLFSLNMNQSQKKKIFSLRRIIDLRNFFSSRFGCTFDPKGNFLIGGFRLALSKKENLPLYIQEYLEKNKDEEAFLKSYPKLYADFFTEESKKSSLVAKILKFEREVNLLLFGFYVKKRNVPVESFLQYEDESNPIVQYIIMQTKAQGAFHFPFEYKGLEESLIAAGADPMKQYLAISLFRFSYYDDIIQSQGDLFTRIAAYMIALWIIEDKALLDEEKGRELLIEILEKEDE